MYQAITSKLQRLIDSIRRRRHSWSGAAVGHSSFSRGAIRPGQLHDFQLDLDPACPIAGGRLGAPNEVMVLPKRVGIDPRAAVSLSCGTFFLTPEIHLESESTLEVGLHVGERAAGRIEISCITSEGDASNESVFATMILDGLGGDVDAKISLSGLLAHSVKVKVARVHGGSGSVDMYLLRISTPYRSGRVNALSAYAFRMRNEISNFSGDAYKHQMYGDQSTSAVEAGLVRAASTTFPGEIEQFLSRVSELTDQRLSKLSPSEGEVPFTFATRALGVLLPHQPPNFFERARKLRGDAPLKILSILSGAARVEEQLLGYCGEGVEITLIDASAELIERAAARLKTAHPHAVVDCLVGDINEGLPGAGQFDAILCVSALHHVANLELVLSHINARLTELGEFWSIGEQIGRNGNRLWPDAYQAANRAFQQLPERLRRNTHTNQVDDVVADTDFSVGCFEGVRSEELEDLLDAYLIPVDVYKRNAFLWRLVDATYGDNFHLSNEEDVRHLKRLVAAEFMHWVAGGRSTELHGVYRKKFIAVPGAT